MTCLWEVTDNGRRVGKFLSGETRVLRADRPLRSIALWPWDAGKATSLVFDECFNRG